MDQQLDLLDDLDCLLLEQQNVSGNLLRILLHHLID